MKDKNTCGPTDCFYCDSTTPATREDGPMPPTDGRVRVVCGQCRHSWLIIPQTN